MKPRHNAFTVVELCVAVVIVLILLSIFIPYLISVRESAQRTGCTDNLRQLFVGLNSYAKANQQAYPRVVYEPAVRADGYVAFTGTYDDDPFKPGGVEASDVTASLFLLVRMKFVKPDAFVCPSTSDDPETVSDFDHRGNFSGPRGLSYSYAMPFSSSPEYRFNTDRLKAAFVLLADRNPGQSHGSDVTAVSRNAPAPDLARANSKNHGQAGQNVLYVTGGVEFHATPYCGYMNDNIYTAQASKASTQPLDLPADTNGVISEAIGPARPDDSYLVPAAK